MQPEDEIQDIIAGHLTDLDLSISELGPGEPEPEEIQQRVTAIQDIWRERLPQEQASEARGRKIEARVRIIQQAHEKRLTAIANDSATLETQAERMAYWDKVLTRDQLLFAAEVDQSTGTAFASIEEETDSKYRDIRDAMGRSLKDIGMGRSSNFTSLLRDHTERRNALARARAIFQTWMRDNQQEQEQER